jgi:hypothetical protein
MFQLTALKVRKEHKERRAMNFRLTAQGSGGGGHGKNNGKDRRKDFGNEDGCGK